MSYNGIIFFLKQEARVTPTPCTALCLLLVLALP